jgi:hypothetical protein
VCFVSTQTGLGWHFLMGKVIFVTSAGVEPRSVIEVGRPRWILGTLL